MINDITNMLRKKAIKTLRTHAGTNTESGKQHDSEKLWTSQSLMIKYNISHESGPTFGSEADNTTTTACLNATDSCGLSM